MGLGLVGLTPSLSLPKILNQESEPLDMAMVKEFVIAGHRDLKLVKEMLEANPNLVYGRYDWGNGDFEEAIEGAGHLGKREIAEYLISMGARVNLFVLTMLDKSELVIPILKTYPNLIFAKGAHGFTLLHHAEAGESKKIKSFLIEKGQNQRKFDLKQKK